MQWDPLGYRMERLVRAADDDVTADLIRAWRRNRIIAVIGLVCALVMITLSLAQVFGLVPRPMPPALWMVFGATFFIVLLISLDALRRARR
jgi:putative exporter of polyketide antibiotics